MSRARSFTQKKIRSPFEVYGPQFLPGHCRAFCTDPEQKNELRAFGFDERHIHMLGHGTAESLQTALDTFRGRPGTIALASDLRVIGGTRAMLYSSLHRLDSLKIDVVDIRHREDTRAQREERALRAISNARFLDNPRAARRYGSKGGKARGEAAAEKRNRVMAQDAVRRLCMHPKLTFADCAQILGPLFSESTLRRNYAGNI